MTRCDRFYEAMKKLLTKGSKKQLDNFCKKHYSAIFRIEQHMEFMEENFPSLPIGNISEGATREVRTQPKAIQKVVIEKMKKNIGKGKRPTGKEIKKWVRQEREEKGLEEITYEGLVCSPEVMGISEEQEKNLEELPKIVHPDGCPIEESMFPFCCPKCPKFEECQKEGTKNAEV